jgi:hypothetical protein
MGWHLTGKVGELCHGATASGGDSLIRSKSAGLIGQKWRFEIIGEAAVATRAIGTRM